MRKALLTIVVGLLVLIVVVLIKTAAFTSKQIKVKPVTEIAVNAQEVAEHLAGALRFQTVSYQGGAQTNTDAFLGLHQYLEQTFPKAHAALSKEVVADDSLLYTWKGQDAGLKPVLLMSHLDVVPVEAGTEGNWTYPPFAGRMADGYIWGRGALDDKVGVMGILEAAEKLLGEGFQPHRTIYLAFGHDEEIGGMKGAARVAALLGERAPELEFILDEGTPIADGLLPGMARPVALISTAEKGAQNVELTVEATGGHSSMPPPHTAIGILSAAIQKLEDHPMPGHINGPAQRMIEYLGPEMPYFIRLVMANLWLFGPLVERESAAMPSADALIRTTTAVTMIEGGVKENVLPSRAKAVVNFRVLPGDSGEGVMEHVRRTIADPRVTVRRLDSFGSEPSPESDVKAPSFELLQRTVSQIFPQVIVAPSLMIAGTDTRQYAKLSKNVYRFLPMRIGPQDLSRPHGTNERLGVENYQEIVRFYCQLIRNAASEEKALALAH